MNILCNEGGFVGKFVNERFRSPEHCYEGALERWRLCKFCVENIISFGLDYFCLSLIHVL